MPISDVDYLSLIEGQDKRRIALELSDMRHRAVLLRLIEWAEEFVRNLRLPDPEKFSGIAMLVP